MSAPACHAYRNEACHRFVVLVRDILPEGHRLAYAKDGVDRDNRLDLVASFTNMESANEYAAIRTEDRATWQTFFVQDLDNWTPIKKLVVTRNDGAAPAHMAFSAHYEGEEERGNYGHGDTGSAALLDFINNVDG